jgi:hypothetical protein
MMAKRYSNPEFTDKTSPAAAWSGTGIQNKASSLEMGPRYWRCFGPVDDTTVLALYPMHSNSSDTTLLEQADFERLAQWLHSRAGEWRNTGGQNTMTATATDGGGVHFRAFWNSTPNSTSGSFRMSASQAAGLRDWMDDKLANGWIGWRSGVKREGLKEVPPSKADWHLNVVVDWGTGYLADGDADFYLSGPEDMEYSEWRDYADEVAGDGVLVEFSAAPLQQGRWWRTGRKSNFKTQAAGYR